MCGVGNRGEGGGLYGRWRGKPRRTGRSGTMRQQRSAARFGRHLHCGSGAKGEGEDEELHSGGVKELGGVAAFFGRQRFDQ